MQISNSNSETKRYKHYKVCEDLHIHTFFSKDSKELPENYVKSGIERGLSYLGFSDHIDLDPFDKDFGYYNYDQARGSFLALNEKYESSINLLFGLEVTYQSTLEESVINSIQGKPYDYLIGSIHRIDGFTVSGPHGTGFFVGLDEITAYMKYFAELEKMVEMNYFDIIGHFDVIKRYGKNYYGSFRANKYREVIEKILRKALDRGMVLEINSSGFRQDLNEPYPSPDILSMYAEVGGREVVLGSDSHSTKHFGVLLRESVTSALSVSDFEVVVYNNRRKERLCSLSEIVKINEIGEAKR